MAQISDAVSLFLKQYNEDRPWWEGFARHVKMTCDNMLSQKGIKAIVSSRVKRKEYLRRILLEQNKTNRYPDEKTISEGTTDLAGVRIALYSPFSRTAVHELIERTFAVELYKIFTFDGREEDIGNKHDTQLREWHSTHYRIRLRALGPVEKSKQLNTEKSLEIQVVSLLHNVLAQMEHSRLYKKGNGRLLPEEERTVRLASGMVQVGGTDLEELYDERMAGMRSEVFINEDQLGSSPARTQNCQPSGTAQPDRIIAGREGGQTSQGDSDTDSDAATEMVIDFYTTL